MNRLLPVILIVSLAATASATTWDETTDGGGDAGELITSAQILSGTGPLTQITGIADGPYDNDVYAFHITNPTIFSASSTGGFTFGPPRLYLFDASGIGVAGYEDSTNTGASLSDQFVAASGLYYLALSPFSHPRDVADLALWDTLGATDIERQPDGLGAANPLDDWSPSIVPVSFDTYTITLTGAGFSSAVPEPAGLGLVGMALVALRRRRR